MKLILLLLLLLILEIEASWAIWENMAFFSPHFALLPSETL